MNHTKASCGHSVIAVGAPGSPARERCEQEPCDGCSLDVDLQRLRDDPLARLGGSLAGSNPALVKAMARSYVEYTRCGITFGSRAAMDKLAKMYGLSISWD
jgi:hypothetical protein